MNKNPTFNLNDYPGILYARTAGDLATLLGIVHLLLPAITVICQGKVNLQHTLNVLVLFVRTSMQFSIIASLPFC